MPKKVYWCDVFIKGSMAQGKIHIGTSGWSYGEWKGVLYPATTKSADWLTEYAKTFDCTEINSSFYHMPRQKTVEGWVAKVPAGFKFCPKVSRYLTHIKRLNEPEEPLTRFFDVFDLIKEHCGPVLIQLPPSLKFNREVAEVFFTILNTKYSDYNFVLEVRHNTWLEPEAIQLLKTYKIGFVISQSGVGFPYAEELTSQIVYVRFHGPGSLYSSPYTDEMMHDYAEKFKRWSAQGYEVWAFFNNTARGDALENAKTLIRLCGCNNVDKK